MTNSNTEKQPAKTAQATTAKPKKATKEKKPSRLDQLQELFNRTEGASIADMTEAKSPNSAH
jgi:hypothetical protein